MPQTCKRPGRINIVFLTYVQTPKLKGVKKHQIGEQAFYHFDRFNMVEESFVDLFFRCQQKCGVVPEKSFLPAKLLKTHILYQILTSLKTSSTGSSLCTAEFGVYRGTTSMLMTTISKNPKQHYIFDSFEGLSKPTDKDILNSCLSEQKCF